MKYAIIGNGTVAISAIEAIRKKDKQGEITVVSDEPYTNYSRPLISYLLGKKITPEQMPLRRKQFYREHKVELLLNKKAVGLNLKKKEVLLSTKERVRFDRLLLATGGAPIIPEIKGRELSGVFTFTKLGDAQAIEKYIKANKVHRAVVIGGGLIGLKATEALIELKIKVTIVELADRILSATFDRKASEIIQRALSKIGCSLFTNNTVTQIKGQGKVSEVILKDNTKVAAQLVVIAVGVRPDIELVKGTAIKVNKGIIVNDLMQTSVKDVYAAGDCASQLAIWPVAAGQGEIAGYNICGEKRKYAGSLAMNAVELCGIPTISVGQTSSDRDCEVLEDYNPKQSTYRKVVLKNKRIVGTIFVGDIERAGIYTGLIKDKLDVSSFKDSLLDEDFGLVCLPQEYRKHLVSEEVAII